MWMLKKFFNNVEDVVPFYLLPGRKYIIGRRDCDITIPGDSTISRKHAVISISQKDNKTIPTLKDTSKTGVMINGVKILSNTDITIHNNDVASFGKAQIKFKFVSYNISAVTSGISKPEQIAKIKAIVAKLGGIVSKDWSSESTHLIMDKITFTIKVVYALGCGKSIVTIKFFEDLLDRVDQKKGNILPNEKDYLPPVAEKTMLAQDALFLPDDSRKKLFNGKVFVFLVSKQHKIMKDAVERAGGTALLNEKGASQLEKKITKQYLFVHVDSKYAKSLTQENKTWIREVTANLKRNSLRCIEESEIGIAILHNSIQRFCNPAISNVPKICNTSYTQLADTQCSQQTQSSSSSGNGQHGPNEKEDLYSKKRKRIGSTEARTIDKRIKLEPGRETDNKNKTKNIIDIESDGEDEEDTFMFDETALSSIRQVAENDTKTSINEDVSPNVSVVPNTVLTTPKEKIFVPNTEFISPNDKQTGNLQTTMSRKVIIPETALNVTVQTRDDFDDLLGDEEEKRLFLFDITDTSVPEINNKGENSENDKDFQEEKLSSRFLKATANTQESISDKVLVSDSEDNLFSPKAQTGRTEKINETLFENKASDSFNSQQNILSKNTSLAKIKNSVHETAANSSNIREENSHLEKNKNGDYEGKSTQEKPDDCDLSYLLEDDDVAIVTDDDFGMETKQAAIVEKGIIEGDEFEQKAEKKWKSPTAPKKGWLSTAEKISDGLVKEEDPDLEGIPRDLVQMEFHSLVVTSTVSKGTNGKDTRNPLRRNNAQNMKSFKKQKYAGRNVVIKGSDLMIFQSNDEERENMFDSYRKEYDKEDEEDSQVKKMFDKISTR